MLDTLIVFFIGFVFIETVALLKVAKNSDEKIKKLNKNFLMK